MVSRPLLVLLGIAAFAVASEDEAFYVAKWNAVCEACDEDMDGMDRTEWACIFAKLDIVEALTEHELEYGSSFTAADTNSNGVLGHPEASSSNADNEEPTDWISDMEDTVFQEAIVMAMLGIQSGGVEGMMNEVANAVTPGMSAAEVVIKLSITMKENADELWPDDRVALLESILVALELEDIPFSDTKFTIAAGSSVANASIFVPTQDDADRATAASAANLGSTEAASEALGVEVESIEYEARAALPVASTTDPTIMAIACVLLGIATCCASKKVANTRRAQWGAQYEGCKSTGCCSAYALRGWALGTAIAAICLIASAIPIYNQLALVINGLLCIIDSALKLIKVESMAAVAAPLENAINLVLPYRSQLFQLPYAALVPALLAAIWMLITAACAAKRSSTMKAAKCFCFMDFFLLILSVVFYIIFAAAGYFITSPFAADIIKTVTSQCDALVPTMKGMLETVKALSEASDDPELTAMSEDLGPAVEAIGTACDCIMDILFAVGGLFSSGLVAVFASFYSIFIIHGLCCSAKCCSKPEVTGHVKVASEA